MVELLCLDLVEKKLVCDQIVLTLGYDIDDLKNYSGQIEVDRYGRNIPKGAHGSINLDLFTSSEILIRKATLKIYDQIVNRNLNIRRLSISANHLYLEDKHPIKQGSQIDLFNKEEEEKLISTSELEKEKRMQEALLKIKNKFGKNSIMKANNLEEDATTIQRNDSIGGHKA